MIRPWMLVVALVAGAALVAALVGLFLGAVLVPGRPVSSEEAGRIALASVQREQYNGHAIVGWKVDEVDWDPSGQVSFAGQGAQPPAPCGPVACAGRSLWYVRLHAPTQADGSTHSAEVYVDARSGTVVAQGARSVTGATGPPPGARSSPVPPG